MAIRAGSDFCIKHGYVENPGPVYFLDDVTTDRGIVFQPDVYTFAGYLASLIGDVFAENHIVDVGCGWGDKLIALAKRDIKLTGIDYGANIAHCITTYGDIAQWLEHDLEDRIDLAALRPDVIVCSDVIEHLVDPTNLLASLKASDANAIVLSTPERDLQYGYDHNGPSQNLCHIREWNGAELRALLERAGLTVNHVGLTRSSDQGPYMQTQLVVCTP